MPSIIKFTPGLIFGGKRWTLNAGEYAKLYFECDGRFDTSETHSFTGVKPNEIRINGYLQQLDWGGTCSYKLEVYYETSGWVEVFSDSKYLGAGSQWNYDETFNVSTNELATQWRFSAVARGNTAYTTVRFTEWYTK